MPGCTEPPLPLPPPLRGAETGTFTEYSIATRLPDIARRVLNENDLPPDTVERIRELADGIPNAPIRLLDAPDAPDAADWANYVQPYVGQTWLEPPWFFAETYFYRRLLEATGYWQSGAGEELDPFRAQKEQGLEVAREGIGALADRLERHIAAGWQPNSFADLLHVALWGNQADLSLWPAEQDDKPDHHGADAQAAHTLADDAILAVAYLAARRGQPGRLDLLADNAGL